MKRSILTALLLSFIFITNAEANVPLASSVENSISRPDPGTAMLMSVIASMKTKDVEKLLGRKLKLKEKLGLKVLQWKYKKGFYPKKEKTNNKGTTAMILGIIGIVCLALPYAAIAAIPLSILAIIFGNQAKKQDPSDGQAKAGVILGWITVGLIVLAFVIAIAILATWSFRWG